MIYQIARALLRILLKVLYRYEVIDHHRIPTESRAVVVCNHLSNFDPPLLGCAMQRRIYYMAKEELFRVPILGKILPRIGAFPVKRGGGGTQAIRRSIQLLREEKLVGIFPEGTRNKNKNGEVGEAHSGAVMIASRANAKIVPAAIIGDYRLFRKMKVVFGDPIDLTPFLDERGKMDQNKMHQATAHMMGEIQKLIDNYR